jgi:arylsulfatase A-like enzyme
MAAEGLRMTQFYSAAPVCTPSRAALLTGRLPIRNGMSSAKRRVLFPNSTGGIQNEELLIPEALKRKGYDTCCVGKWHLGHLPEYLPTRHGFDRYFGLPYSNDMRPLPLLRGEETIEMAPDQSRLTVRYTDEAVQFIRQHSRRSGIRENSDRDAPRSGTRQNSDRPFFLYLAHTMPHVPLFAAEPFAGKSSRGLYGDVVETIDHSTGQILRALRDEGLSENTLVVFTSDNGPWLIKRQTGGSAGLLREGKGSTWEGGMRVPGNCWWPGKIKAGTVSQELASTLDLFSTCLALANVPLPQDRQLDGYDLSPVLLTGSPSPRETMYFYRDVDLFAIRQGPWKLHVKTQPGYGQPRPDVHEPPLLYHLEHDPSEQHDVAKEHPEVVAKLQSEIARHQATVTAVKNQLE